MSYRLVRESDGMGDSGPMCTLFKAVDGKIVTSVEQPEHVSDIEVGHFVRVGSFYARSYSAQDYWTTTAITEILETSEDPEESKFSVRFKTTNSIYTLDVHL